MEKNKLNINIILLSCLIFLVLIVFAAIYFLGNLTPRKYKIANNITEISENQFEIMKIEKGSIFSKIYIKKVLGDDELKDYVNYVSGPGKNYYFNYKIILENSKKTYKIKTIIKDSFEAMISDKRDPSDNSITIEGIFLNKDFFKQDYNISIIQDDYINNNPKDTIRKYYKNIGKIGENNEKNIIQ